MEKEMERKRLPIGVFDSGVGGLTVVKEIMTRLPNERILYFGDTARVPYGSKSRETVIAYSRQITRFLLEKGVKAIVVACGTASAFALETLQAEVSIPILGVVKSGAQMAAQTTKNGRIGIIGTEGTIRSGIYEAFLKQMNPALSVFGRSCPLFVPLAEEGWLTHDATRMIAREYLSELLVRQIDTLVLGCTHYPLLREVIRETVGAEVTLVNPAYETAHTLEEILREQGLLRATAAGDCSAAAGSAEECDRNGCEHRFYVSDGAEKFRRFANSILPCEMIETKAVNTYTFEGVGS